MPLQQGDCRLFPRRERGLNFVGVLWETDERVMLTLAFRRRVNVILAGFYPEGCSAAESGGLRGGYEWAFDKLDGVLSG